MSVGKGYNLIVIDTVNWLNEKTKMVKEATMWAEKKTKIVEESSNEEKPSQDLTLQTV